MNNLHRELAPISDAAWVQIEEEARRTFTQWVAGAGSSTSTDPPELSSPLSERATFVDWTNQSRVSLPTNAMRS
nr:encapsulin [Nonomuraea cypriaca]